MVLKTEPHRKSSNSVICRYFYIKVLQYTAKDMELHTFVSVINGLFFRGLKSKRSLFPQGNNCPLYPLGLIVNKEQLGRQVTGSGDLSRRKTQ